MTVRTLTVTGLRGFAEEQRLRLAQPSGEPGSGITILVGPNSSGKSTVVDAMHSFSKNDTTFSQGKRNDNSESRVRITVEYEDGATHELRTVDGGGSETVRDPKQPAPHDWYVLPSRRFFPPYFDKASEDRRQFLLNSQLPNTRSTPVDRFHFRLFTALKNADHFNDVLKRVIAPVPDWTIDQSDQGDYFIRVNTAGYHHNSDGLGEGIVSLLFVVDALYDSSAGDKIVVDEPELSLHPIYQRRLLTLLADYAKDRQIIYATHSPYFVDFQHILNGAQVASIHKRCANSMISQLSQETIRQIGGLTKNLNNPHVLGVNARESLFQEEDMIVVEGQEDVVYYGLLIDQLKDKGVLSAHSAAQLRDRFFGWGAGGAANIEKILLLLRDLGFQRVAAIVDKNEASRIFHLRNEFSTYHFSSIPADDIRTKRHRRSPPCIYGILDQKCHLRDEFVEETEELLVGVATYLLER